MPQIAFSIALATAFVCTVLYLHALFRLHGLIAVERPDWVNVRGALDFFYTGFPRVANPSVGAQVVKVAFSSKARELQSPLAARFVHRIRVCLPVAVAGYLVLIVAGA